MADEEAPYKKTFIRAWRKFRKMSLDELAHASRMDKGNLSKLERGHHPYKQDTLDAVARVLGTTSEVLITRGPEDATPLWRILDQASPTVRRQIEEAAFAIYRAGKEN